MTDPYLYISPALNAVGSFQDPRLSSTTERHKLPIQRPAMRRNVDARHEVAECDARGIVIEMQEGWASTRQLALTRAALDRSMRVWFYWPGECAIEVVDRERVDSWRHHRRFILVGLRIVLPTIRRWQLVWTTEAGARRGWRDAWKTLPRAFVPNEWVRARRNRNIVDAFIDRVRPVPLALDGAPSAERPIRGTGVYLRTDFWVKIHSGGSYGHTSYVVKELARVTEHFVCFMAHPFALIESFGITQIELGEAGNGTSEDAIVEASRHYFPILRAQLEQMKPAYIYERAALGSYAGAVLSRELQIPYILEYNGSEMSMLRTFNGAKYTYEDVYERVEELGFRQATFISVVSEEIKKTLVARGVPASKILVNPNGADLDAYQPAEDDEKRALRRELGLPDEACVVAFSGTFGGWHGVDVLAAAIPRICADNPRVFFLLIGDGNFKHEVDEAVARHHIGDRVVSVGRVPQSEGARLLKACDLYVSPHSSNMVDSRFFGSPTKVFEYMAMAGGVIASDLEQIGVVLSPALRVEDLRRPDVTVGDQRSVLCAPGHIDEFVDAVLLLSRRPELWPALGRNARQAVADNYSWRQHIEHLWRFARSQDGIWGPRPRLGARFRKKWSDLLLYPDPNAVAPPLGLIPAALRSETRTPAVATGDAYKDEVQRQWDNDPAGSHYVGDRGPRRSLDWFLEVERHRYGQYAPWMRDVMEFDRHAGERVLEIGGGLGTDLVQFAKGGAVVTDLDLSAGHLDLARENFALRGLHGEFVLHDAEKLPFDAGTFDLVYSNGVLHHTPNTTSAVAEIRRVLKPGGLAIVMVYAENSLHYWRNLVWEVGLEEGQLLQRSMGDIMSEAVERSPNSSARPLVKVYTTKRLRGLFEGFDNVSIVRRQMLAAEKPRLLKWVPLNTLETWMGWNLIIKARKPVT
jgi:glycosyltransferase involved in cell wall biosynthesis/SAM-dependent methyltransferase